MNGYNYECPFKKEELETLYVEKRRTYSEIANMYGFSVKRVQTAMKHLKIKPRTTAKRNQYGEKNPMWRGKCASYAALHKRVEKQKGKPKECEVCGVKDKKKMYHWASMTGDLTNISDYKRMCVSCHCKYDKKIRNITGRQK